ncbi:hypothetical protein D9M71_335880 [compost metagenome]
MRQCLIQTAVLVVAKLGCRAPLRRERGAVVQQLHVDGPIGDGHKVGDAAIAIHHQAQGRRLHPADRQHALIARLAPQQGEQPTHVHADQPVGPGTPQGRVIEAEGLVPRFEGREGLADGRIVQRRQPEPADRPAIAAMLHQFPGDHLALAVGVRGNDQFGRFTEQALDRLVLAGGARLDGHFPFFGNDRQVGQHPALVARVVGIRRCGFQQVADAPGHRDVRSQPAAIAPAPGAEDCRNVFGLGRFFTEVQPHNHHRRSMCQRCTEWRLMNDGAIFICMDVQVCVSLPFGCEAVARVKLGLYLINRGLRFWGCCAAHRGQATLPHHRFAGPSPS